MAILASNPLFPMFRGWASEYATIMKTDCQKKKSFLQRLYLKLPKAVPLRGTDPGIAPYPRLKPGVKHS